MNTGKRVSDGKDIDFIFLDFTDLKMISLIKETILANNLIKTGHQIQSM